MDIIQLSKKIKKKILVYKDIEKVELQDKSFLHKNHDGFQQGKFHVVLIITSKQLKKKTIIESNKIIYKLIEEELEKYIHSIQIKFI